MNIEQRLFFNLLIVCVSLLTITWITASRIGCRPGEYPGNIRGIFFDKVIINWMDYELALHRKTCEIFILLALVCRTKLLCSYKNHAPRCKGSNISEILF